MIKTPVVVKTEEDFDGRPIALLVQEARDHCCDRWRRRAASG